MSFHWIFLLFLLLVASPGLLALLLALLPLPGVPLRYNFRNLQVRWKTGLITALAFTLVIALLVVMLAFVQGMYRLSEDSGQPGNVMILSDGATDEAFSSLPGNVGVENLPAQVQGLIAKAGKDYLISREMFVVVNHVMPASDGKPSKRRFLQMRGVDNAELAGLVHGISLQDDHSRWFSGGGVREVEFHKPGESQPSQVSAYEVVLGDGLARTLGEDRGQSSLQVGTVFEIARKYWVVVGVMKPSGSSFGSELWTRDTHVGENFGRINSYSTFVVRLRDPQMAETAAKLIKDYRYDRALQAFPEKEYYAKLNQTNETFLQASIFVAIIMAIGGVLGIMNTMFAAISQRTKDIGVLRLLGFTRWQILVSFLLESMLIALLGGLLGCLLGFVADGYTAKSVLSSGQGGGKGVVLKLVVDQTIIAVGLLFTVVMGSVGGLIPSLSVLRLRPLESLR